MKKKLIVFTCVYTIIVFSIGGYLYYHYFMEYSEVYVASHNINQRTCISINDLKAIKVPKTVINEHMITNKEDLINRFVKLSYSIPNGSFIYKDCLEDNIKDLSNTLLKENEVTYDLFVSDIKMNTGHLNTNMYLDLYLTIDKNDKVLSDLLLSNCRIIGFFDSYGKQIFNYDNDSRIYIVSLAINKNDVSIINKALVIGTINCVVNSTTYRINTSSIRNENSILYDYLL